MNNGADGESNLFGKILHYYNYILETQYYLNGHLIIIQTYYNITRTQGLWVMQTFLTLLITFHADRFIVGIFQVLLVN